MSTGQVEVEAVAEEEVGDAALAVGGEEVGDAVQAVGEVRAVWKLKVQDEIRVCPRHFRHPYPLQLKQKSLQHSKKQPCVYNHA